MHTAISARSATRAPLCARLRAFADVGEDLSFGEGNEVKGNLIGTAKDGTSDLGNDFLGVAVRDADDNFIWDFSRSGANTIAFNGLDGVFVGTGSGTGNRILSNSIFSNGGLGIDFEGGTENTADATKNDPGDTDGGSNNLQNKPMITSATTSGGTTTVKAKLNSTPSEKAGIRAYAALPDQGERTSLFTKEAFAYDAVRATIKGEATGGTLLRPPPREPAKGVTPKKRPAIARRPGFARSARMRGRLACPRTHLGYGRVR